MIRCQVLISDSHSIDFRQSVQNSQKWAYRGDGIDFRQSELILTVLISDTIYIYAIGFSNLMHLALAVRFKAVRFLSRLRKRPGIN